MYFNCSSAGFPAHYFLSLLFLLPVFNWSLDVWNTLALQAWTFLTFTGTKPHSKTTPPVNLIPHLGRTTSTNKEYSSLYPCSSAAPEMESKTPVGKVWAINARLSWGNQQQVRSVQMLTEPGSAHWELDWAQQLTSDKSLSMISYPFFSFFTLRYWGLWQGEQDSKFCLY